jgi:hypothetical protein
MITININNNNDNNIECQTNKHCPISNQSNKWFDKQTKIANYVWIHGMDGMEWHGYMVYSFVWIY